MSTIAKGMTDVAIIGFGEAAQAFATSWRADAVAYDRKTDAPSTRSAMIDRMASAGVRSAMDAPAAVVGASVILSLVTADQSVVAATEAAAGAAHGSLFLDMNSVSPGSKRTAAGLIAAVGGRHVDVAVMSPVLPGRLSVPLLVAGPHAEDGLRALASLGFSNGKAAGAEVGDASAVKMIRSVMVKGIEALSAECALAASQAGVLDEVIASLDASPPSPLWLERLDYNLDRMLFHGVRRAAEMDEVVSTLDSLGTGSALARATASRQRSIGSIGASVPEGLQAKLELILSDRNLRMTIE